MSAEGVASELAQERQDFRSFETIQMCDRARGRRATPLLTCRREITGFTMTPDGRTLFVNVPSRRALVASDQRPVAPTRWSRWPDGDGRTCDPVITKTTEAIGA
jgi:secreted PhoX family phosphatase